MVASASGGFESVECLLGAGADPNAQGTTGGETAVMFAAARRRRDVLRRLIEAGADVNLRDHDGATALHRALTGAGRRQELEDTIGLLLAAGADAAIADRHGQLPSDRARYRKWDLHFPWLNVGMDGWRLVGRDRVVRMLEGEEPSMRTR